MDDKAFRSSTPRSGFEHPEKTNTKTTPICNIQKTYQKALMTRILSHQGTRISGPLDVELRESGNNSIVISRRVEIKKNHLIGYFDLNRFVFVVPEDSPKSSLSRM
jgi:hypothetical protein